MQMIIPKDTTTTATTATTTTTIIHPMPTPEDTLLVYWLC